jgi:UDP-GlcNAc:undecaprenyl-phosphate GlcNAc-1-phosphate transferase
MDAAGLLIPLAVAFGVAALLTRPVGRLARTLGALDRPSERSVSLRPDMPLLGGLAVAAGVAAGLALAMWLHPLPVQGSHLAGLAAGSLVILALGIWDDRFGLDARGKFAGQVLAAVIAIAAGFQMTHITEPVTRTSFVFPQPLAWAASLLWIVGISNAINLIDGLDGLASGVGAIIAAALTWILVQAGEPFGACLGAALVGGLLGFLPFNFPPARIFLGDTGSLFVGYLLALLALDGYRQVTVITFVVPLLALALPILDTLLSILRRARTGHSPFRPDRQHVHHRLLARRGSTRAAVLQFWFLTACFALIAVSFTDLEGTVAAVCLVAVLVLTVRALRNLGLISLAPDEAEAGVGEASARISEDRS